MTSRRYHPRGGSPLVLPQLLTLAAIGASSVPMPRRSDSNVSEIPRICNDEGALLAAEQKRARKAAKRARDTQKARVGRVELPEQRDHPDRRDLSG